MAGKRAAYRGGAYHVAVFIQDSVPVVLPSIFSNGFDDTLIPSVARACLVPEPTLHLGADELLTSRVGVVTKEHRFKARQAGPLHARHRVKAKPTTCKPCTPCRAAPRRGPRREKAPESLLRFRQLRRCRPATSARLAVRRRPYLRMVCV